MQLQCTMPNGIMVTVEGKDQKEIFEQLSEMQEVFGQSKCGKCGKEHLKFQVREVEGNKFYEQICLGCFARLGFGSHKKGNSLFPKRKDNEGNYLPDSGWMKWDKDKGEMV